MTIHCRVLAFMMIGASFVASPAQAQAPSRPVQFPTNAPINPWANIAPPPVAEESEDADDAPAPAAAEPVRDADAGEPDWSQLVIDGTIFSDRPAVVAKSGKKNAAGGSDMNWSTQNNANGSSGVSVKQSVAPFWDARVGADMTVAKQPTTMSELLAEKAQNGGGTPQSGGSAWAAVTAPGAGAIWDKTAVEARLDPGLDQGKVGATITKTVPLIDQYNLTLQNGYNVIQQGVVPLPGAATHTNRSYDTDQSAKLVIGDTGTSLTAGQSLSSAEEKWLRRVGAEQKLTDGLTVSGAVGQTAQGTTSKSISAGFKRSW